MQQLKRQQQMRNQLAESEATTNDNLQKHNRAQQRKEQNANPTPERRFFTDGVGDSAADEAAAEASESAVEECDRLRREGDVLPFPVTAAALATGATPPPLSKLLTHFTNAQLSSLKYPGEGPGDLSAWLLCI
jgi:hypothetical protein